MAPVAVQIDAPAGSAIMIQVHTPEDTAQSSALKSEKDVAPFKSAVKVSVQKPECTKQCLNTCPPQAIKAVKSIGEVTARTLVNGRPWRTWEDVARAEGIGEQRFIRLQKFFFISDECEGSAPDAFDIGEEFEAIEAA